MNQRRDAASDLMTMRPPCFPTRNLQLECSPRRPIRRPAMRIHTIRHGVSLGGQE
jgi:hypothetical protein